jgi:hypothetical protein
VTHLNTTVSQRKRQLQYSIFQWRIETVGRKFLVACGARKARQLAAQLARKTRRAALYAFVQFDQSIDE